MSDRLTQLLPELRRPFTAAAVKIKPQVVTKDQTKGLVTFYIDSRLLVERLNTVVGAAGWTDSYRLLVEGQAAVAVGLPVECSLTVEGVTKVDVGQLPPGEMDDKAWKSAYSDAFKRAGVKFGVGAFLYNLPNVWAATKIGQNGKAQGFSDEGAKTAKAAYVKWLTSSANIYGKPLDHGDVAHEQDAPAPQGQSVSPSDAPADNPASEAQRDTIEALVALLGQMKNVPTADVRAALESESGPLAELSEPAADLLLAKLKRWEKRLEASGGEQAAAGSAGPSDTGSPSESVSDAPAEEPLFKAPTAPRGSKARAKAREAA